MKNSLFLKALRGENQERPPVWLMRQAGRYMPEYRAFRDKYSFLELVHTPELAAEITLLPINLLNVDAAILFSDILVMVEALGMKLLFDENLGPRIDKPLNNAEDVYCLPRHSIAKALAFVPKTIQLLVPQLKVPLIGFCGAPFTIASYMIEGKSSKDLRKTKEWMFKDPDSFHQLLQNIVERTIEYLEMQVDAGVHAIQIFDSWANFLGHAQFCEFSLHYLKILVDAMHKKNMPVILFCRGSSVFAPYLASIKPTAISLDWNCDVSSVKSHLPSTIALQGNLDPDVLFATPGVIVKEATRLVDSMKGHPGYIFNLGHGVLPGTPFENVRTLVDTVQSQR